MITNRNAQQSIAFLCFLAGLLILAWWFLPVLPEAESSDASTLPLWTETQTPTPGPPCYDQSISFLEQLLPLNQEWLDATQSAGAASVVELPAQLTRLQDIRRRALTLRAPLCAAPVLENLVAGMTITIQAYSEALEQRPDVDVQARFAEAEPYFVKFRAAYHVLVEPALAATPEVTPEATPAE